MYTTSRAGTGRARQLLGSRGTGSDPFRCGPARHAWAGHGHFLGYSFVLHTSHPALPLQRNVSLLSRSLFLTARPRSKGSPKPLPSHSNPNFMHISSFGCLIAASSPKNSVYKGTCCGSFCLSVCAFHDANLDAWIV
jgi:hypothetical protein